MSREIWVEPARARLVLDCRADDVEWWLARKGWKWDSPPSLPGERLATRHGSTLVRVTFDASGGPNVRVVIELSRDPVGRVMVFVLATALVSLLAAAAVPLLDLFAAFLLLCALVPLARGLDHLFCIPGLAHRDRVRKALVFDMLEAERMAPQREAISTHELAEAKKRELDAARAEADARERALAAAEEARLAMPGRYR